jgi:hypothetical protein
MVPGQKPRNGGRVDLEQPSGIGGRLVSFGYHLSNFGLLLS